MVQSPSWEANWFAASQEITRISRNPNIHYRKHKRLPPVLYCALMQWFDVILCAQFKYPLY